MTDRKEDIVLMLTLLNESPKTTRELKDLLDISLSHSYSLTKSCRRREFVLLGERAPKGKGGARFNQITQRGKWFLDYPESFEEPRAGGKQTPLNKDIALKSRERMYASGKIKKKRGCWSETLKRAKDAMARGEGSGAYFPPDAITLPSMEA